MSIYQNPRYHESRWQNLVKPLFEQDGTDRTFLDLGCNAGFYMLKAEKLGYRAIGIERDIDYISQAPDHLDIIQGDVNYYDPHCAYLTLLSCVHYHQTDEQVEALLHNLTYSTIYLLVMGRHAGVGKSDPSLSRLLKTIHGWDVIEQINGKKFYTVLLKNRRYEEMSVDDLYKVTGDFVRGRAGFLDFVPQFAEFTRRTLADHDFDPSGCSFMDYLRQRRLRYKLGRCWTYKKMIKEIKERGIHTALKVQDGRIKDGYHRLIVLRELGIKRVVCRVV